MSDEAKKPQDPQGKESLEMAAMQDDQMQDVHAQLAREKEEPQEGFNPVPIFLLFIFAALCFWGGVYLIENGGDFRADVFDPHYKPGGSVLPPPEVDLFVLGQKVYKANCIQCHQADGNGITGVNPPLAGSDWVTGHPEVLARILINGLNGPIVVKGNTYNGNMPAFGPGGLGLRPKQLAGVMTYIRQEWGNEASDMTEEMATNYLDMYAARTTQWQAPDLKEGLGPIPTPPVPEEVEDGEASAEESADSHVEKDDVHH